MAAGITRGIGTRRREVKRDTRGSGYPPFASRRNAPDLRSFESTDCKATDLPSRLAAPRASSVVDSWGDALGIDGSRDSEPDRPAESEPLDRAACRFDGLTSRTRSWGNFVDSRYGLLGSSPPRRMRRPFVAKPERRSKLGERTSDGEGSVTSTRTPRSGAIVRAATAVSIVVVATLIVVVVMFDPHHTSRSTDGQERDALTGGRGTEGIVSESISSSLSRVEGGEVGSHALPMERAAIDGSDVRELPSSARLQLAQNLDSEEAYMSYVEQIEETRTILSRLATCRLFEELRPCRFDGGRFVDEILAPRHRVEPSLRAHFREMLAPLAEDLMAERKRIWIEFAVTSSHRTSLRFNERSAIDQRLRRAWQELDRRLGHRIEEVDREIRSRLNILDVVLARPWDR